MSGVSENLSSRLKDLIDNVVDHRGKFGVLESETGISSESWRNFYYGKQRPTPDMIEGICKAWPQFALWIVTGEELEFFGLQRPRKLRHDIDAGPLLRALIKRREIAKELSLAHFDFLEADLSEAIEREVDRYADAVGSKLIEIEGAKDRLESAIKAVNVEVKKLKLQVSRLHPTAYKFSLLLKGFPWLQDEAMRSEFEAVLKAAEVQRGEFLTQTRDQD